MVAKGLERCRHRSIRFLSQGGQRIALPQKPAVKETEAPDPSIASKNQKCATMSPRMIHSISFVRFQGKRRRSGEYSSRSRRHCTSISHSRLRNPACDASVADRHRMPDRQSSHSRQTTSRRWNARRCRRSPLMRSSIRLCRFPSRQYRMVVSSLGG